MKEHNPSGKKSAESAAMEERSIQFHARSSDKEGSAFQRNCRDFLRAAFIQEKKLI